MAWSDRFDDPISLPGGGQLRTLEDAGRYMLNLKKTEQDLPHWQLAAGIVKNAAEGQDFLMHARIAMLKALHHGQPPPEPGPRRKRARAYKILR
jgi:hypothetical protein